MIANMWKRFVNRETVSYLIFGILTTLVDWVIFSICFENGFSTVFSTNLAWTSAVAFAFVTNKLYVFRSYGKTASFVMRELVSFVGCRLISLAFSVGVMVVLVDIWSWPVYVSKALVSVAVIVMNYVFGKLFVFTKKKNL